MMKKKTYLLVFLLFLLSACGTSIDAPIDNKGPINPTKLFTPIPSSTSKSTQTIGIPKTSTPTISPEHLSFLATREALIDEFADHCERPALESIGTSPNGEWVALHCYTDNGQSIKLIRIDETKEWELSYFDVYGSKHDSIDGCLCISHWSKDGNYVYIKALPQMDGIGFAFIEATALYRLHLDTGQLTETITSGTSRKYYSFAFSPNDRRLAYIDFDSKPFALIVLDMSTGSNEIILLDPKYDTGGNFIWSSDSQRLVFCVAKYNPASTYIGSVLLWDNEQKTIRILIDDSDIFLVPVRWSEESKIILESEFTVSSSKYEFDLINNTLTLITP